MARFEMMGRPTIDGAVDYNLPVNLSSDFPASFSLMATTQPSALSSDAYWYPFSNKQTQTNSGAFMTSLAIGSPSVGEWAEWKFPMPAHGPEFAGGYAMYFTGYKNNNYGYMKVHINGILAQVYDLYNASLATWGHSTDLTSLGMFSSAATLNTLRLTVETKNPSSSAQYINFVTAHIYAY